MAYLQKPSSAPKPSQAPSVAANAAPRPSRAPSYEQETLADEVVRARRIEAELNASVQQCVSETQRVLQGSPSPGALKKLTSKIKLMQETVRQAESEVGFTQAHRDRKRNLSSTENTAMVKFKGHIKELQDKLEMELQKITAQGNTSSLLEARRQVAKIREKLCQAEIEIDKSNRLVSGDSSIEMSASDIDAVENVLSPLEFHINSAIQMIGSVSGKHIENEVEQLSQYADKTLDKFGTAQKMLQKQRAIHTVNDILEDTKSKVVDAERSYSKIVQMERDHVVCTKGECESVAEEVDAARKVAWLALLRAKAELAEWTEQLSHDDHGVDAGSDLVKNLQGRIDHIRVSTSDFRSRVAQRELQDTLNRFIEVENEIASVVKASEVSDVSRIPIDALRSAHRKHEDMVGHLVVKCKALETHVQTRQREVSKEKDVSGAFLKIEKRLVGVHSECRKLQESRDTNRALLESRIALDEEDRKITKLEEDLAFVDAVFTRTDKAMLREEEIKSVYSITQRVPTSVEDSMQKIDSLMADTPPPLMDAYDMLLKRASKCEDKSDEVRKYMREEWIVSVSKALASEAHGKTRKAEFALEMANDAVRAFARKSGTLPLTDALEALTAADAAFDNARRLVVEAYDCITSKKGDLQNLPAEVSKPALQDLSELKHRLTGISERLQKLKREIDERRCDVWVQEASDKLCKFESISSKPLDGKRSRALVSEIEACIVTCRRDSDEIEKLKGDAEKNIGEIEKLRKHHERMKDILTKLKTVKLAIEKAQRMDAKKIASQAKDSRNSTNPQVQRQVRLTQGSARTKAVRLAPSTRKEGTSSKRAPILAARQNVKSRLAIGFATPKPKLIANVKQDKPRLIANDKQDSSRIKLRPADHCASDPGDLRQRSSSSHQDWNSSDWGATEERNSDQGDSRQKSSSRRQDWNASDWGSTKERHCGRGDDSKQKTSLSRQDWNASDWGAAKERNSDRGDSRQKSSSGRQDWNASDWGASSPQKWNSGDWEDWGKSGQSNGWQDWDSRDRGESGQTSSPSRHEWKSSDWDESETKPKTVRLEQNSKDTSRVGSISLKPNRLRSRSPRHRSRSRTPRHRPSRLKDNSQNVDVERFISRSGVDSVAAQQLREAGRAIQQQVMQDGDLNGRNPSAMLIGRLKRCR